MTAQEKEGEIRVQVVIGSGSDAGGEDRDGTWLSRSEVLHSEAIKAADYRAAYVASHQVLRQMLVKYLGEEARSVEYRRTCRHCGHEGHGKPFIEGPVDFSLSHSGRAYLVAVADRNAPIGVDLELVSRRPVTERLKQRCCTPEELLWLDQSTEPQSDFLTLWTRKEAVTKAAGTGIVTPFSEVASLGAGGMVGLPGADFTVRVCSFRYPGAVGALAVPRGAILEWKEVPSGFELVEPVFPRRQPEVELPG